MKRKTEKKRKEKQGTRTQPLENEKNKVRRMKNKKMKLARVEKELSQEELAELVGVSRQTIGLIETGKFNPSLQLCLSICRSLGKTLDELFWEEGEAKA